jgi:hypothetical protein
MTQNIMQLIKDNDTLTNALIRSSALERFGNPEEVRKMALIYICGC